MESSPFPIFAWTNLTSVGTAMQQKKTIPLIWGIEDFTRDKWKKIVKGEKICGPDFKFHPLGKESWKLEIIRKNNLYDFTLRLSMVIRRVSECESTAFQFVIYCGAAVDGVHSFVKKKVSVPANVRQHEFFENEKLLYGTDFCDMLIQIQIDDNVAPETAYSLTYCGQAELQSSLDEGRLTVLANMENILAEAKFADAVLSSEGKEIRAHRAILAGRSQVFESMFQHQMSEKASGSVDISDVTYDTLQKLVSYMYSGRLADLDVKSASELFVASDKYAVEDLHCTCSLFLKRSLAVENCLEILMLADTHSNEDLKSSAVAYFSQHSKVICQKPDWDNVIKVRPAIAFELLKVLANRDDCVPKLTGISWKSNPGIPQKYLPNFYEDFN